MKKRGKGCWKFEGWNDVKKVWKSGNVRILFKSSLLRSRIWYSEEAAHYLWLGQRLNGALVDESEGLRLIFAGQDLSPFPPQLWIKNHKKMRKKYQ